MIIAITILGITMALAYAALHVANRTIKSVAGVQSEVEALRTTNFLLKRHLSQSSNRNLEDGGFQGDRDELTFFTEIPMRAYGGGRVYRFRLHQRRISEIHQRLMLTYAPVELSPGDESATQVLAEFEGDIRFSYLSSLNDDGEAVWQDAWMQAGLPQLVKLQLVNDDSVFWPEQVIQLRYAGIQVE